MRQIWSPSVLGILDLSKWCLSEWCMPSTTMLHTCYSSMLSSSQHTLAQVSVWWYFLSIQAQVAHLAGTVNCNSSVGSVVSIVTTTGNINNSKSVAPDAKNPVVSNCQPQGQSLTQGNQGQVNQVMGVTPTLVAGKAAMLPQQNGAPLMLRPIGEALWGIISVCRSGGAV